MHYRNRGLKSLYVRQPRSIFGEIHNVEKYFERCLCYKGDMVIS